MHLESLPFGVSRVESLPTDSAQKHGPACPRRPEAERHRLCIRTPVMYEKGGYQGARGGTQTSFVTEGNGVL